jgi:hypothetical protein
MSANPEARPRPSASGVAGEAHTELVRAWGQFGAAATPEEFCESWLALQCHAVGEVNDAAVVLQKPGSETFAPLAFWPAGRSDRSRLAEIAERGLREGRGIVQARRDAGASTLPHRPDYQIAYPVRVDGVVRGVVALDAAWRDDAQLQAAMRQLQWGCGWLEVLLRRFADPMEAARLRVKLILELVSVLLEREDFGDAATALVTELGTRLGCDRVTLGLSRQGRLRVEAISHTLQFDRHANLVNATVLAMTEALDQREAIVYPPERDGRLAATFAHAELAQMTGAGGIASLPLLSSGRPIGALTLERAPGFRFDAPTVELLEGLGSMLGPILELRISRSRGLLAHAADSTGHTWRRLAGPGHGAFKLMFLLLGAALLYLGLAQGSYRIAADARIEGEIQRAITAPFPTYVREARYRAGDTVKQGEVLARLDDRDLRLESTRLTAQKEQLGKQYREAMAKRDRSLVRVVGSQIDQVDAQLGLVQEQLSRTAILAPFDSVLVSGDLTQALGAPIERGQVLFEVAPLEGYRVVLEVDERSIADLRAGQRGELVLSSMPGAHYAIAVQKITPVSTARDGRNFFRVEASLEAASGPRLRPGMAGVAKVHVDERRLIWIWTRELRQWLTLKAWTWIP